MFELCRYRTDAHVDPGAPECHPGSVAVWQCGNGEFDECVLCAGCASSCLTCRAAGLLVTPIRRWTSTRWQRRGHQASLPALILAVAVAGPLPAQAAGSTQPVGKTGWNIVTVDQGCTSYFFGAFFNDQQSVTWSGRCQAGSPISGKGTLALRFADGSRVSWTGQFVDGFLHGSARMFKSSDGLNVAYTYDKGCEPKYPPGCRSERPANSPAANPALNVPYVLPDDPKVLGGAYQP